MRTWNETGISILNIDIGAMNSDDVSLIEWVAWDRDEMQAVAPH
jgi:hypothetical protein